MADTQNNLKMKQKPKVPIIAIIIVIILLIATAFLIYRSYNGSVTAYSQFKKTMLEVKKMGDDYAENGMKLQADYYYGMAASSISAMRFATDNILHLKGESKYLEDAKNHTYADWDSIAALSSASPYPYYFEGLVYHIQGDKSQAEEAYQNALLNPLFSENSAAFYYLGELSIDELIKIRDELYTTEAKIYEDFTPEKYDLERHPMNYNDEYLRAQAKETLGQEPNNYAKALHYYYAALRTNPFEAKNYACCAITAIYNGDIDAAIYYVNEGLWVDENNEELNQIAAWLTQRGE